MRIKSNFKDYYDYVAHVYGGRGDPKIVYNRTRIRELEVREPQKFYGVIYHDKSIHDFPFTLELPKGLSIHSVPNKRTHEGMIYEFAWLIVAGRYFPMARKKPEPSKENQYTTSSWTDDLEDFLVITPSRDEYAYRVMMSRGTRYPWDRFDNRIKIDNTEPDKTLIEISKLVGHPVFVILNDRYQGLTISRKCPHLAKLGLVEVYPDTKIYQDLSYFIGNLLHSSPDMMPDPKPPMTNEEKIVSHGFDSKKSFRHRK